MERPVVDTESENEVSKAFLTDDLDFGKVCCLTMTEDLFIYLFLQSFPEILQILGISLFTK